MRDDYLRFDFIDKYRMYGHETQNLVVKLDSIIDCCVKLHYDFNNDKFYGLVLRIHKYGSSGYLLFPKKDDLSGYIINEVIPQNVENTEEIVIASAYCDNEEEYHEAMKEFKCYYDIIRKKQYEYFGLELDD